jgi:hypothetical protein
MTRDAKTEKVRKIISDFYGGNFQRPFSAVAKEIVDVLEEEEPERFFAKELVHVDGEHIHYEWDSEDIEEVRNDFEWHRLPAEILAATIGARIEYATWWSIDADGLMEWWREEPAWCEGKAPGDLQGWVYGGTVDVLRTNIRQEPDKGEL